MRLGRVVWALLVSCQSAQTSSPDGGNADGPMQTGGADAPLQTDARPGGPDAPARPDAKPGGPDAPASGTPDSGTGPIGSACTPPIQAVATDHPTTVVGTGPGTCNEAGLKTAVAKGGVITFNCGASPVTILLGGEVSLRTDVDTVIDGGGLVTLDGQHATRILDFESGNFLATTTTVTLQHLTLQNAKVSGTMPIAAVDPNPNNCSQGFYDGAGGAVYVRDGILHVIDCVFKGNQAEALGPDVGGGAIYTVGSLETIVVGSQFIGNSGANGGAVGSLFSRFTSYRNVYMQNTATGHGENGNPGASDGCPCIPPSADAKHDGCMSGQYQTGSGGNGGAVAIDGGDSPTQPTFTVTFCGDSLSGNQAGGLGGAIFRTPDAHRQKTFIQETTIDGNGSTDGGAAFYFHNTDVEAIDSTISGNSGPSATMQADGSILNFVNVTIAGNHADHVGGALGDYGNSGTWTNVTMANNTAGEFAAGIQVGGDLTFKNVLVANNLSPGLPMACHMKNSDGGHNVQFPQAHAGGGQDSPCTDNVTWLDPMLGALGANGGPTATLVPAATDAALQSGAGCPDHDQRLHPRSTASCTVGAVQLP